MNKIFLNLPIKSARESVAFYTALGFVENRDFWTCRFGMSDFG
jgi:predicted lactoylglutathione lyase